MAHQGCKVFPLVKEVRAYVKEGDGDQGADCHDVALLDLTLIHI